MPQSPSTQDSLLRESLELALQLRTLVKDIQLPCEVEADKSKAMS